MGAGQFRPAPIYNSMNFSSWLENRLLLEGRSKRAPKPVQMPKPESNKIEPKRVPKQRIAGGRRDTTFDDTPKASRTRAEERRRAIEDGQ